MFLDFMVMQLDRFQKLILGLFVKDSTISIVLIK